MADHERAAVYTHSGKSSSATKTDATEQTSGFFNLSAELRNMIYHELVRELNTFWIIVSKNAAYWSHKAPVTASSPITQVCRQTRAESLPIVYGANVFSMTLLCETDVKRAKEWTAAVGDTGIEQVRRIILRSNPAESFIRVTGRRYSTYYNYVKISRFERRVIVRNGCEGRLEARLFAPGPIDELKACIKSAGGRTPLTTARDMVALWERSAASLYLK